MRFNEDPLIGRFDVAQKSTLNEQYLYQILAGKSSNEGKPRSIGMNARLKLTKAFPDWLDQPPGNNTEPGPDIAGTVPLISLIAAGNWSEAIDNLSPGEGERIEVSVPVRTNTFALRVTGDSMEPDFPSGIIIVVEPDLDPRPGDYVIAKNGDDATFKQLVKDGPDLYLKPINPRYPIKPLGEARIIGVVREAIRRFR